MIFLNPYWFLLVLLIPLPWLLLRGRQYLGYSDLRLVRKSRGNSYVERIPLVLFSLAVALLAVCLARPQVPRPDGTQIIHSRDIIVAVDISGSMLATFEGQIPPPESGNPELDKELPAAPVVRDQNRYRDRDVGNRRIDAARSAVTRFVRHRFVNQTGDRVGILMFNTEPFFSWPLTDDLKQIYRKGLFVDEGAGGGTNFGQSDPGPIDAAVEHFDERGQAASRVIIIVTDGEDYLDASAMGRLRGKIEDRSIRFYVIGVGEELRGRQNALMELAGAVNGQVFHANNAEDLAKCFDSIDQLERSAVPVPIRTSYEDHFSGFAIAALLMLIAAALAEVMIVRQ